METVSYGVGELTPYINWIYYLHAWGIKPRFAGAASVHDCHACRASWVHSFPAADQAQAAEALRLCHDSLRLLASLEHSQLQVKACFHLARAASSGDDLLLDGLRFPLLRQQQVRSGEPCLCLSDFVRPLQGGEAMDHVGLFATSFSLPAATGDTGAAHAAADDPYRELMLQTLADRLAEAAVERLHLYVRREAWGYAPDEQLSIPDLLCERFQGIRPAVGYPSLPDQSVIFLIDRLLPLEQIGIRLTESGAMHPHASTCGLMLAHPASRYFAVGRIDHEQLADYARRRGLPLEEMRRFLQANL
ncbi:MAG: vitamin B12 dependent-methionine synthase activation domain-containing protein [Bacteroides sp.]